MVGATVKEVLDGFVELSCLVDQPECLEPDRVAAALLPHQHEMMGG